MDVVDDGRRQERRNLVEDVFPIERDVGENTRDVMDCVPLINRQLNRLRSSFRGAEGQDISALRTVVDLELVVGPRMARTEHEEPEPIPLLATVYTLLLDVPHCVVARTERGIEEQEQAHHGCSRRPCPERAPRKTGSVGQFHGTRRRPGCDIQKVISFTIRPVVFRGTHNLTDGVYPSTNQENKDGASNTQDKENHDTDERPLQRSCASVVSVMRSVRSLLIAFS